MSESPNIGQFDLEGLLRHAGSKPARYGKRWDCPSCGKSGRVSVDFGKSVYHCWHAGCSFKGSAFTLARSLGFASPTPQQAQTYRRERDEAETAARCFAERLWERRHELYAEHRELLDIRRGAHSRLQSDPQNKIAWDALRFVHGQTPIVRVELLLLESAPVGERLEFIHAPSAKRAEHLQKIVERDGLTSHDGRFLEIGDPATMGSPWRVRV